MTISPSAAWPLTGKETPLTCFTHSPSPVRYKLTAWQSGGESGGFGITSYMYIPTVSQESWNKFHKPFILTGVRLWHSPVLGAMWEFLAGL